MRICVLCGSTNICKDFPGNSNQCSDCGSPYSKKLEEQPVTLIEVIADRDKWKARWENLLKLIKQISPCTTCKFTNVLEINEPCATCLRKSKPPYPKWELDENRYKENEARI